MYIHLYVHSIYKIYLLVTKYNLKYTFLSYIIMDLKILNHKFGSRNDLSSISGIVKFD